MHSVIATESTGRRSASALTWQQKHAGFRHGGPLHRRLSVGLHSRNKRPLKDKQVGLFRLSFLWPQQLTDVAFRLLPTLLALCLRDGPLFSTNSWFSFPRGAGGRGHREAKAWTPGGVYICRIISHARFSQDPSRGFQKSARVFLRVVSKLKSTRHLSTGCQHGPTRYFSALVRRNVFQLQFGLGSSHLPVPAEWYLPWHSFIN